MIDVQLPVLVTDLFYVFGMTDPSSMLIILLSAVLGVLLVLIVLLAFRGRPSESNLSHQEREVTGRTRAEKPVPEPIISKATQSEGKDAVAAQSANQIENSGLAAEQVEEFQIFRRPRQKSSIGDHTAPLSDVKDQMSTADHLRLIEKEMIRLRDLYQGGHITRDMYIDETRSLYFQARELSSIS